LAEQVIRFLYPITAKENRKSFSKRKPQYCWWFE